MVSSVSFGRIWLRYATKNCREAGASADWYWLNWQFYTKSMATLFFNFIHAGIVINHTRCYAWTQHMLSLSFSRVINLFGKKKLLFACVTRFIFKKNESLTNIEYYLSLSSVECPAIHKTIMTFNWRPTAGFVIEIQTRTIWFRIDLDLKIILSSNWPSHWNYLDHISLVIPKELGFQQSK